jgi:hypothetical protein
MVKISTLACSILCSAISTAAFADIDCKPTETLGVKGLACVNELPTSQTIVSFREMPGWNGNASLVMIDMCSVPSGSVPTSSDPNTPAVSLTQNQIVEMKPTACIRRVCTQDMSAFSFRISGIPIIPITAGFGLGFSFGFSLSQFEVTCSLLGDQK